MEQKWLRLTENTVLHKPSKMVYETQLVRAYDWPGLVVLNFQSGPIFAARMTVKKDNISNFDLDAKEGGLLWNRE